MPGNMVNYAGVSVLREKKNMVIGDRQKCLEDRHFWALRILLALYFYNDLFLILLKNKQKLL